MRQLGTVVRQTFRCGLVWACIVPLSRAARADEAKGVDVGRKAISINFYDEPKTLDAQKADDTIAGMVLGHSFEGLTRLDPGNRPIPGQAVSWEMKGKTEYVFKLRQNAVWSDGKPVTAQDFVTAWRRAVDPKTASQYAFIMYAVKNGEAINAGKLPIDQLGVKALDDHTLDVTLERPTAYFLKLTAFATYYPVRADILKQWGTAYATDADKMVYNGPFVIGSWKHNAALDLVKNEKYWNKAQIHLNEIDMPYLIRDKNSEFNMFKDGKFAMTWALTKELLPEAQLSKMQIRKYNDGSVWYFQMNTKHKITGNKNFRKAFQLAMNREEFVKQVQGLPGTRPAFGLIPEYMPGVQKRYSEEYPLTFKDAQIAKAKEYLAKAKKELGLKRFPPLDMLITDTDDNRRDAEYFQRYYKEKLGLDLQVDVQTFKVRLERSDKGDFDLVYSGWSPDYLDVMSFADLFASWNKNNNTGWSSPIYDAKIKQAMSSTNPKERLDLISAAEKILVEEAPIVPFYQRFRVYTQDPRLVGVIRRAVGADPDFYYARLTPTLGKK